MTEVIETLRWYLPSELRDHRGRAFLVSCSSFVDESRATDISASPKELRDSVERVRDAAAELRKAIRALPEPMRYGFGWLGVDERKTLEAAPNFVRRLELAAATLASIVRVNKGVKSADINAFGVASVLLQFHKDAFGSNAELKRTGWFVMLASEYGRCVGVTIGLARLKNAAKFLESLESK